MTSSSPPDSISETDQSSMKMQNWTWGCIYLLGHCLSWAGWMVLQAPVVKKYPAKLTLTSFTCFFGLIQFLIIAAFVETDMEHWKIQSTEEIFTVLYAGVVSPGIVISLQTWFIQKSGPVFVAVFQPMQMFLVAVMAALILGDQLHSGGITIPEDPSLTKPLINSEENRKADAAAEDIPWHVFLFTEANHSVLVKCRICITTCLVPLLAASLLVRLAYPN